MLAALVCLLGLTSAGPLTPTLLPNGRLLKQRDVKRLPDGSLVVKTAGWLNLDWRPAEAQDRLCSNSPAFYRNEVMRNHAGHYALFSLNYAGLQDAARLWVVRGPDCSSGLRLAGLTLHPEGSTFWKASASAQSPENRPPAVAPDGSIYVQAGKDELHAFGPDGKLKWRYKLPAEHWSEWASALSIGPDGSVYAGLYNGDLLAVTPQGREKWRFRTAALLVNPPTFGPDGTVYVGAVDHKLYALTPAGQKKWVVRAGMHIYGRTIVTGGGLVVFTSDDGFLHAVNASGGQVWQVRLPGVRPRVLAASRNGTVYVSSFRGGNVQTDSLFMAVNPAGQRLWSKTSRAVQAVAIAPDGTIYTQSLGWLSAWTPGGTRLWSFNGGTGYFTDASVLIGTDSTIYTTFNQRVYALNPDGSLKWLRELTQDSPKLAMSADGTLYVSTWNGELHALYTTSRGLAGSAWPSANGNARGAGQAGASPERQRCQSRMTLPLWPPSMASKPFWKS